MATATYRELANLAEKACLEVVVHDCNGKDYLMTNIRFARTGAGRRNKSVVEADYRDVNASYIAPAHAGSFNSGDQVRYTQRTCIFRKQNKVTAVASQAINTANALEAQVAKLTAERDALAAQVAKLKAFDCGGIRSGWNGEKFVPVPLPEKLSYELQGEVAEAVSKSAGEGDIVGKFGGHNGEELVTTYLLLLEVAECNYIVKYSLSDSEGTVVETIYGACRI